MRIIRFVADDGRVLCGEERSDGVATVLDDRRGVLVATPASSRLSQLHDKLAVVADDDENMRRLVCTVLEKAGCRTVACADGAEAMHAISEDEPDLVVSDIMMPHHNGYEIYSTVKQRRPDVPVILITGFGYDPSHSLLRASHEGVQGILYKPFTPQQLVEALVRSFEFDGDFTEQLQPTGEQTHVASLLPPVRPGNIICIGRNYRAAHQPAQDEPELDELEVFMKPTTALQASGEPIRLPESGENLLVDCEGELAVVVGRTVENVSREEALGHVLGYTIANDITARRWQTTEGAPRWMRGKGFNTFCPLGPTLVTLDELNEQPMTITTSVNGRVVRQGSTVDMVRPVAQIISDLSRRLTLEAGTVVLTGAPPPLDADDRRYLQPGDEVAVEITGIGRLVNPVAADG